MKTDELIDSIDKKYKEKFATGFLKRFLKHGFGTMPKREMEILIFHLLMNETNLLTGFDNHEIANILKLSETRVKSFKSEVSLKYKPVSSSDALKKIACMIFDKHLIKPEILGENIEIFVEEPELIREFKYAVKKIGHIADSSFNSEIIRVKTHVFIAVFLENFIEVRDKLKVIIRDKYPQDKLAKKVLQSNKTWSVRIEEFIKANQYKMNLIQDIISPISRISGIK